MVRDCGIHHRKFTVRHTHVEPVDRPATKKVRMLVPFPILLLYRKKDYMLNVVPLRVDIFLDFSAFAYERALCCSKLNKYNRIKKDKIK